LFPPLPPRSTLFPYTTLFRSSEYSTWLAPSPAPPSSRLQNCESYAGEGALRIQTSAGGWSQTRVQLPEPVNEGELHARFWAKVRSEEHTSELQSRENLVCRLL